MAKGNYKVSFLSNISTKSENSPRFSEDQLFVQSYDDSASICKITRDMGIGSLLPIRSQHSLQSQL